MSEQPSFSTFLDIYSLLDELTDEQLLKLVQASPESAALEKELEGLWSFPPTAKLAMAKAILQARDESLLVALRAALPGRAREVEGIATSLGQTLPATSPASAPPIPASPATTTTPTTLGDLLTELFTPDELIIALKRMPWGDEVLHDLPSPQTPRRVFAFAAAARLEDRRRVDAELFDALVRERPRAEAEIRAVQAAWDGPSAPAQPATPASERDPTQSYAKYMWFFAAIGLMALAITLLVWPTAPLAPPTPPEPTPASLPLAPAPTTDLGLTLLVLPRPTPAERAAPTERVATVASALTRALAERPRAALLLWSPPQGADVEPVLAALGARAADALPVLAVLPDLDGMPLAPGTMNAASSAGPIPSCGASDDRRCVDALVLPLRDALGAAWTEPVEGQPAPPSDSRLVRALGRCDGTRPGAALALAALALGEPATTTALVSRCRDGAVGLRAPPSTGCDAPFSALGVEDLDQPAAPRPDLGTDGGPACPRPAEGWIRGRSVVIADPWTGDALRQRPLALAEGETRTIYPDEAAALGIAAWNLLGWLEQD